MCKFAVVSMPSFILANPNFSISKFLSLTFILFIPLSTNRSLSLFLLLQSIFTSTFAADALVLSNSIECILGCARYTIRLLCCGYLFRTNCICLGIDYTVQRSFYDLRHVNLASDKTQLLSTISKCCWLSSAHIVTALLIQSFENSK